MLCVDVPWCEHPDEDSVCEAEPVDGGFLSLGYWDYVHVRSLLKSLRRFERSADESYLCV